MKLVVLGTLLAGLLLTMGCINLWTDSIDIKTYMVEAERTADPAEKPLADKLWVDSVSVLPPYNIRNFVLRKNDVEFTTSYYTELLLSPSENFRNNFYTWFSDSALFQDVSLDERRGLSHRLAVSVLKFYGDSSGDSGAAVLEIKVTLFDEKTRGIHVLLSKNYLQKIDVPNDTAESLIRAYNQALQQILIDCEKDIRTVLENPVS